MRKRLAEAAVSVLWAAAAGARGAPLPVAAGLRSSPVFFPPHTAPLWREPPATCRYSVAGPARGEAESAGRGQGRDSAGGAPAARGVARAGLAGEAGGAQMPPACGDGDGGGRAAGCPCRRVQGSGEGPPLGPPH